MMRDVVNRFIAIGDALSRFRFVPPPFATMAAAWHGDAADRPADHGTQNHGS